MSIKTGSVAIYRQIIEYFEYEIASGRLKEGERVESIRTLASNFKVNPNTVQKALTELERDGLIVTDRTNGKFVTDDKDVVHELKLKLGETICVDFIEGVVSLGLSKDEVIEKVSRLWEEKNHG
ncbi:MAG: GntR family transcriptional regulator [Erysipelothrix sp.]